MSHGWLWVILGAIYLLVVVFFIALGASAKRADEINARAFARHRAQMNRRRKKRAPS